MEDVNKRRRIFLSLSKLECGPQEINPREYRCLHLKFSERLKKMRIHFKSDVFAAVAHPCGPVNGPQPRPQGFSLKKWEKPWGRGWMDPASPGGFRQTVLQVQSPQKRSCHSNIPTWGLASLRSWRYLLCFERVTAARKVNGGWNRTQWGRGRGEKAFFSLPSPLGPSSIVFLFVLISAFAHQLRRLERLIP